MTLPHRHRNITMKRMSLDAWQFIRAQSFVAKRFGRQFTPNRRFVEIDITYRCNLKCINCNRSCTQAPSDAEMPVSTIEAFIDESIRRRIAWTRIRILGGEPALHSRFLDIIDRLAAYRRDHNPTVRLVVGTSYHGRRIRRIIENLPSSIHIKSTLKRSRVNLFKPFNVAPKDRWYNHFCDYSCGCRIISECGLGLTPSGYYMCAVAGGIDRIVGYRLGQTNLPDATDALTDQMRTFCPLCGHFGFQWPTRSIRQSRFWRLAYEKYAQQLKNHHDEGTCKRR